MKRTRMVMIVAMVFLTIGSAGLAWGKEKKIQRIGNAPVCSQAENTENISLAAYAGYHTTSLYPPPSSTYCYEPIARDHFYSTNQVMDWAYVYGMTAGQSVQWIWYAPDGTPYPSLVATAPYSGNQCWWHWWPDGIPNIEGRWSASPLIDGQVLYTAWFYIEAYTSLSTIVDPPEAGKVIGPGIDCGGDCWEPFWNGESVTLTAVPNEGWKSLYLENGTIRSYGDKISVVTDSDQVVTAKFIPEKALLKPDDRTSLGNRIPLILVHGNGSEDKKKCRWADFIVWAKNDKEFNGKYKIYIYRWDSNLDDMLNGLVLGLLIDMRSDLVNRKPVILTHSRGVNVARSYMNYYVIDAGKFKGKLGGYRVKYLPTLAGPYLGSPGADSTWVTFSSDTQFSKRPVFAKTLSTLYFDFIWEGESHPYITWDDRENRVTNEDVCWDSSLMGDHYCSRIQQNIALSRLNKKERFFGKMVAFGGNNYDRESVSSISRDPRVAVNAHRQLDLGSALMAFMSLIPNDFQYGMDLPSARPFQANDGAVPLVSQLFLKPGAWKVFEVNEKGELTYSKKILATYTQVKEVVIIKGNIDHLDFLDRPEVVGQVIGKLKILP